MKRTSFKILTLSLLLGAAAASISAQGNTCGFQVNTVAFKNNSPIKGATLTLTRADDGQIVRPGIVYGRYENIVPGKYKLQVAKTGFDSRDKELELTCGFADGNGMIVTQVYLGDPVKGLPGPEVKDGKGILKGVALYLPKPLYPDEMRGKQKTSKEVSVQVFIDEDGNVTSGNALNDNSALGEAAVRAAMNAKFQPTRIGNVPVRVTGNVTYNFVP